MTAGERTHPARASSDIVLPTSSHSEHPSIEGRAQLVQVIENAYAAGRYDSPELRAAVRAFVTTARHGGLGRDHVVAALADILDAGVQSRVRRQDHALMSERVMRWGRDAYGDGMCDVCAANEVARHHE